jgi:Arc/MetJ-type ribon-helix-helix transcriptional regulator
LFNYIFLLTIHRYFFILEYEIFILRIMTMGKTVKFAVSMSEEVFKELESLRRRKGWTRSQFIRDAVRSWKTEFLKPAGMKEKAEEDKKEIPSDIVDLEERQRRAISAAGRFRSGISDLSLNHDKHLEDSYAAITPKRNKKRTR